MRIRFSGTGRRPRLAAGFWFCLSAFGQDPDLGTPPAAPDLSLFRRPAIERAGPNPPAQFPPVNTASREESRIFYRTVFQSSQDADTGWSQDGSSCDPGTTSAAFREQVRVRINYFRALAGVPAWISFDDLKTSDAQAAALMMCRNNQLSHYPPNTWLCYTAGGAAMAGQANLALGSCGPEAISGYLEDYGGNNAVVGHRRWLLYPQTQVMATGDVPAVDTAMAANTTCVFDGRYGTARPATREAYVAWPPPGFVPYPVVFARWSFALSGANFTGATITMTSNGVSVPVVKEAYQTGVGEPTVVWRPWGMAADRRSLWPRPAADVTFQVTVDNVMVGANKQRFDYQVKVFDPDKPGADTVMPALSGSTAPSITQPSTYTLAAVPCATGYQVMYFEPSAGDYTDGAENGLDAFTARTSSEYTPLVDSPVSSGSQAFHLAHPMPAEVQALTLERLFLCGTNARVRFQSRLGYATETQVAKLQISTDDGQSWQDEFSQAGTGSAGEKSFRTVTVSLAQYAHRLARLRWTYAYLSGQFYPQTDSGVGWYIDDISVSGVQAVTNPAVSEVSTNRIFSFPPSHSGPFALVARAEVYDAYHLDWGPAFTGSATNSPATNASVSLALVGSPVLTGGQFKVDLRVTNWVAGVQLTVLAATAPIGPWTPAPAAVMEALTPGTVATFRATVPVGASPVAFYEIRATSPVTP